MKDKHFSKKLENYHFTGKILGKGQYGVVELAVHALTNVQVAVKVAVTRRDNEQKKRRHYLREVSTLRKLNHPGIVKIYEKMIVRNKCYMVLEYVDGGDLLSYVKERPNERLKEEEAKIYFKQIVSVLVYLHKRCIVHRDLKLGNILLQGPTRKVVKVIDFGLSNSVPRSKYLSNMCGTMEYAAPEVLKKDCRYRTEVDIWGLGIVLYRILAGELPFRNDSDTRLVELISNGLTHSHYMKMAHLNPECVVLLSNLLQPDPSRRYSVHNIMSHVWTGYYANSTAHLLKPQVIDPRIKQKVVSTTAELTGLSKTEVNSCVELRKCDRVFAVYGTLLQEQLQAGRKTATRTNNIVAMSIDRAQISRASTAVHERSMPERSSSQQEGRLHTHGRPQLVKKQMFRRDKRSPECYTLVNGNMGVVGKRIGRYDVEIPSAVSNEDGEETTKECEEGTNELGQEKGTEEDEMEELNKEGSMIIERKVLSETTVTSSEELTANTKHSEPSTDERTSSVSIFTTPTFESAETGGTTTRPDTAIGNSLLKNISEPQLVSNQPAESDEINDTVVESEASLSTISTLSIKDENGEVENEGDSQDLCEQGVARETSTSREELSREEERLVTSPACVTLQVLNMKQKAEVVVRRRPKSHKFAKEHNSGTKLSTIPSKETVNPTRDLEETIEARLKPCLKNSAASIRQRPHTAVPKVLGRSNADQDEMIEVVKRPKTAEPFASFTGTASAEDAAWRTKEHEMKTEKTKNQLEGRLLGGHFMALQPVILEVSGKKIIDGAVSNTMESKCPVKRVGKNSPCLSSTGGGQKSQASAPCMVVGKRCMLTAEKRANSTRLETKTRPNSSASSVAKREAVAMWLRDVHADYGRNDESYARYECTCAKVARVSENGVHFENTGNSDNRPNSEENVGKSEKYVEESEKNLGYSKDNSAENLHNSGNAENTKNIENTEDCSNNRTVEFKSERNLRDFEYSDKTSQDNYAELNSKDTEYSRNTRTVGFRNQGDSNSFGHSDYKTWQMSRNFEDSKKSPTSDANSEITKKRGKSAISKATTRYAQSASNFARRGQESASWVHKISVCKASPGNHAVSYAATRKMSGNASSETAGRRKMAGPRSSARTIADEEHIAKTWEVLEKLLCTGKQLDTGKQSGQADRPARSPTCESIPSNIGPPTLIAPHPSANLIGNQIGSWETNIDFFKL